MTHSPSHPIAGSIVIIVLVAMLITWSVVSAFQRTVRIDDVPMANHWPDMRVNINRADAAELSVLPGLGPSLAQRIVDDRQRNGPFRSVDDLDRVPGIGASIVERLRPYAVTE